MLKDSNGNILKSGVYHGVIMEVKVTVGDNGSIVRLEAIVGLPQEAPGQYIAQQIYPILSSEIQR